MKPIDESSSPGPDADHTVSRHVSSARPPETLHGESRLPLKTPEPAASILADPLLTAATPLLHLLGLLAGNFRPPDIPLLRERAGQEISLFEKKCRDQGVPMELLRPSHYALCASLDDVALNSPWGAGSVWSDRPLARTRYRELHNETQFFAMLDELRREPTRFLSVLELFYFCLSFGFQGPYRRDPRRLDLLRSELSTLIVQQREAVQPEAATTFGSMMLRAGAVPAWIPLLGALAVAGASYLGVSYELNRASRNVYLDAVNAPPTQTPAFVRSASTDPPPSLKTPIALELTDMLRETLKNAPEGNVLAVVPSPSTPAMRISVGDAFSPGGAQLRGGVAALLAQIGAILKSKPISIEVIGYAESTPARTARSAPGVRLSTAQAEAVRSAILRGFGDATRISAEAAPVVLNASPEGPQQNRRIEVMLHPQR